MKKKLGRMVALAMVFAMVFAAVAVGGAVEVRATDEAQVLRAVLQNRDAGVQIRGLNMVAGDTYTLSFWLFNAEGSPTVQAAWGQWPTFADEEPLIEGASALGEWVFHEVAFTALPGGTDIQLAPDWNHRDSGDVFYLSSARITAGDGTTQVIAPGQMHAAWDTTVVNIAVVANPAPTAAAAAPAPAATVNPLTGDGFSPVWMLASGVGLLASMAALAFILRKKNK